MWGGQMQALAARASWWAADLPGFGDARAAPPVEDLDQLAFLIYEGMRSAGVTRAVVAGCSMGGYLAFGLLRVAPQFVAGLALINTKSSADDEPARARRLELARRVEREGCAFLADEWPPSALSPATLAQHPDVACDVRAMISRATPQGVAAAQRAMAKRPDSTPLLHSIRVPTVVIFGADDRLISEGDARSMSEATPGATFVCVPDAGHLPNLEQPAVVDTALIDLLARVAR